MSDPHGTLGFHRHRVVIAGTFLPKNVFIGVKIQVIIRQAANILMVPCLLPFYAQRTRGFTPKSNEHVGLCHIELQQSSITPENKVIADYIVIGTED